MERPAEWFYCLLFRPNSFTLITANRVMNFIADTPEDVNGWVEGKKKIIVQQKTLSLSTSYYFYNCETAFN